MSIFYLSLGSNLDYPKYQLQQALILLVQKGVSVDAVSRFYYSKPMGPVLQNDFYNIVCRVDTVFSPLELLGVVKDIEQKMGRVKVIKWGARVIDIDIVYSPGVDLVLNDFAIPHAGCWDRLFVLYPWLDVANDENLQIKIRQALLTNRVKNIGQGFFC